MRRGKMVLIFSVTTALLLVSAILMLALPLAPSSHAQTESRDTDGSSSRAPEELDTRFENAEVHDKASIEAQPYAPDDRETEATDPASGAAMTADPYPIQHLPLPGGLGHLANGTGTRNAGYGSIRLRGAPAGAVKVGALL